jgi:N-acetylmuramate 1-kinase
VSAPVLPTIPPAIEGILSALGHKPPWREEVAGSAGSGRIYWRIGDKTASHILLQSHPADADYSRFLSVTRHLREAGLKVPRIFGSDDENRLVVLEDLGSTLLLAQARSAGFPGNGDARRLEAAYLPALEALATWQDLGTRTMHACPDLLDRVFDLGPLLWESSYFARRCAEESFGMAPERLAEPALLSELARLALRVEAHPRVLMHRDFQSQNLMSRPDGIWFVDYQGARSGSRWYDLASLLWDPYVALPMELRRRLFLRWLELAPPPRPETAWNDLLDAALQRVMQALGAYGFLSRRKGVPWFGQFLTPGLAILSETLAEHGAMPALSSLVEDLRQREALPL